MTADPSDLNARRLAKRRCPTCRKPTIAAFRPFCSARCRDVDLGRWLTESYVVPGRPPTEDGDEDAPSQTAPNGRLLGAD